MAAVLQGLACRSCASGLVLPSSLVSARPLQHQGLNQGWPASELHPDPTPGVLFWRQGLVKLPGGLNLRSSCLSHVAEIRDVATMARSLSSQGPSPSALKYHLGDPGTHDIYVESPQCGPAL